MNKKTRELLEKIILEGNNYSFSNNSLKNSGDGYYSKASDEFMAWISKVENFINLNYSDESGPNKMMSSVKKEMFNRSYSTDFDPEITKVKGAIKSCLEIKPNKRHVDHEIITLIKSIYFWTVLSLISGAAYKLGIDNGKSNIYESNYTLNKKVDSLNLKVVNLIKLNNELAKKANETKENCHLLNTNLSDKNKSPRK